jgi:tetratricopeptide (TPR) repeat protein
MLSLPGIKARSYIMMIALAMLAVILPSKMRGDEEPDAKARPRSTQYLIENTYLGHAAQMPRLEEPADVLLTFLDRGRHGSGRLNVEKEIFIWKRLNKRYPDSRYAYFGLGGAYRLRFAKSKSTQDLQRAISAYAKASEMALSQGRIVYTRELSEAIVKTKSTKSVEQLDRIFGPLIDAGPSLSPKEFYLALVDYGDGLAALADERAWEHFERAIDLRPQNNIEAINRYAQRLLERGRAREALDLLEGRVSRDERIRRVVPAYFRREAMTRLGLDASSADEEIAETKSRLIHGAGAVTAETARTAGIFSAPEKGQFAHTVATDDCRNPTYAQRPVCGTYYSTCYYPYAVNLAEIIWNEARGEYWGQGDMVGWTVRNRVLQRVSCDAYPGGTTYTTCRSTLPCGDGDINFCNLSRWYCCAEHGGTTAWGTSHDQFNDAHVAMLDLELSAIIFQAYDMINGRIPDPSRNFIPYGISGCSSLAGCGQSCTTGANQFDPSPYGPMEYRGSNYCALASSCKWYAKNVCGNLPVPTSCSTGDNAGDNHFWNRYN